MEMRMVLASPHIKKPMNTRKIMLDVVIALVPALAAATVIFGIRALLVVIICVVSCIFFEWGVRALFKKEQTITDLSAVVTGMILAFNLPVGVHFGIAILGCFIAIVIVKQLFGGIGENTLNPAAAARVVLLLTAMGQISTWSLPLTTDAVSTATPLLNPGDFSLMELFLGNHAGSLGETCAAALLLGGIYLLIKKVIHITIPLTYIGTVICLSFLLGEDPLRQILTGGLILGAFFMATDYSSSPLTHLGKVIYGLGLGLITVLIRAYGPFPEGVSFAIVLMNLVVPPIEKATRIKPFGSQKKMARDIIKPALIAMVVLMVIASAAAGVYRQFAEPEEETGISADSKAAAAKLLGTDDIQLTENGEYTDSIQGIWSSGNGKYAVDLLTKGYGGEINLLVGIGSEGSISGIKVISHSETEGLGSKVLEDSYLDNFTGLKSAAEISGVDAITSATISSEAVKKGIVTALEAVEEGRDTDGF